jgi:transcriptional regulator with XRE-family HTH domain
MNNKRKITCPTAIRATRFGRMLKDIRIRRLILLRNAARLFNYDVSALSKIERGINFAPPERTVRKWARMLVMTPNQTEKFVLLSVTSKNEVSNEPRSEKEISEYFPVFVHLGKKITLKQRQALSKGIADSITGDHVLARLARECPSR